MLSDTAVILAAGLGTRLGKHMPKGLVPVAGYPMLSYSLGFLHACNVRRIVLVGGFQFSELEAIARSLDPKIEPVLNTNYEQGNIVSLACGLERVAEGGVLLFHADHIFRADIAERVRQARGKGMTVFTDHDRLLGADDMKVATDGTGKFFKRASKQLRDYRCGYVGITYCGPDMLPLYRKAVEEVIRGEGPLVSSERAMQYLADQGAPIRIADISGSRWLEVDYPEELARADEEIRTHGSLYPKAI